VSGNAYVGAAAWYSTVSIMAFEAWRYEPLDPRRFPVGEGPFRVTGAAFVTAMSYVDRRLPGGRKALLTALGSGDPFARYYDQSFDAALYYDVSPLLRLLCVGARITHAPVPRFIEARSRWSAALDARGPLKPAVKTSPERMAERMHLDFNRYVRPTHARTVGIERGRFDGELAKVPAPMNGFYVGATVGFVSGALSLVGATEIHFEWEPPSKDGQHAGVPVERLRFVSTWLGPRA
jgi:hypothetical protein